MSDQEYEVVIVDDNPGTPVDTGEGHTPTNQESQRDRETDQHQAKRKSRIHDRIDELTRKWRTEERQREQEQRRREQIEQEHAKTQKQFQEVQQSATKTVYDTLSKNKILLENYMRIARQQGDTDTENKLHNDLVEVTAKIGRIKEVYPDIEQVPATPTIQHQRSQTQEHQTQEQGQQPQTQEQGQQPAEVPDAAKDWAQANGFLREHPKLHSIIAQHDQILRAKGEDPRDPGFYKKLNERLKQDFPEDVASKLRVSYNDDLDFDDDEGDDTEDESGQQQQQQQSPPAAGLPSDGRPAPVTGGKQKVKMTRSQLDYCQRNGIDPKDYAKQIALDSKRNPNGYVEID